MHAEAHGEYLDDALEDENYCERLSNAVQYLVSLSRQVSVSIVHGGEL